MKLRFAPGVFTERILDYVLSCRCQVVGNSEFIGGVMLSTILPAWLTTIFIWDRYRAPSSALAPRGFGRVAILLQSSIPLPRSRTGRGRPQQGLGLLQAHQSSMVRGPHRLALCGKPYRLGRSLITGHSKATGQGYH
jgi:hypothetical protein